MVGLYALAGLCVILLGLIWRELILIRKQNPVGRVETSISDMVVEQRQRDDGLGFIYDSINTLLERSEQAIKTERQREAERKREQEDAFAAMEEGIPVKPDLFGEESWR